MTLRELEAQRTQAAARLDKLTAPARALEAAEQELADLDEQIAAARQQDQEARQRDMQRQQQIAAAWARYHSNADLGAPLRDIHSARLQLVALGVPDPGDRRVSAEAIAAPLIERDRLG